MEHSHYGTTRAWVALRVYWESSGIVNRLLFLWICSSTKNITHPRPEAYWLALYPVQCSSAGQSKYLGILREPLKACVWLTWAGELTVYAVSNKLFLKTGVSLYAISFSQENNVILLYAINILRRKKLRTRRLMRLLPLKWALELTGPAANQTIHVLKSGSYI